ncbi:hypothetical protein CGLO_03463 [Colletotrichum gloeosporioides Cg-14]|uniref:F-box domain-containing protein n=1 Tax=Colletotrichum gloeosporioides (strain Cg-14) TaxID=1237896 RepID=T0M6J1_COLGC|nr:hypothetical protein CGLO_03463 [Colletotrichum gloeosporioides Cg-14]
MAKRRHHKKPGKKPSSVKQRTRASKQGQTRTLKKAQLRPVSRFLQLPQELRDHVYDLTGSLPRDKTLVASGNITITDRPATIYRPRLSTNRYYPLTTLRRPLLQICRQIQSEALDYIGRHNRFVIDAPMLSHKPTVWGSSFLLPILRSIRLLRLNVKDLALGYNGPTLIENFSKHAVNLRTLDIASFGPLGTIPRDLALSRILQLVEATPSLETITLDGSKMGTEGLASEFEEELRLRTRLYVEDVDGSSFLRKQYEDLQPRETLGYIFLKIWGGRFIKTYSRGDNAGGGRLNWYYRGQDRGSAARDPNHSTSSMWDIHIPSSPRTLDRHVEEMISLF